MLLLILQKVILQILKSVKGVFVKTWYYQPCTVCVCVVITFSRLDINRVCIVANPARGQQNRENGIFLICPGSCLGV